ncbi:MAG: Holliday junction resolvase RuvX [Hydrogenothermaceae bacterium]|nr:Holliday junction resolvase RuvX [Hydrogenothermaceae bacterium]
MSRIVGLDVGSKRIGIAVSDPFLITASPKGFIQNDEKAIEKLKEILQEFRTKEIVVGLPLTLKGLEGEQANYTRAFVERLNSEIPDLKVHFVDERFTTSLAQKYIDPKRSNNKGYLDTLSAVFILQTYLDSLTFRS